VSQSNLNLYPKWILLIFYSPDLALVRFSPPITPGPTVNTACLPTIEVFEGMQGEIIGYGRTIGGTSSLANFIKEVQMKYRTWLNHHSSIQAYVNVCTFTSFPLDGDFNICLVEGDGRSCSGDSGGSFLAINSLNRLDKMAVDNASVTIFLADRYEVLGVTSFGRVGCPPDQSFGYVNVLGYLDWINERI